MALQFPNNPIVGQLYTYGTVTWQWNGTSWTSLGGAAPNYGMDVYVNGHLVQTNISLNFVNTSAIIANVTSNVASNGALADVLLTISGIDTPANAYAQANAAYARANAFSVFANAGLVLANVINIAYANTATVNASVTSNTPNGVNVSYTVNVSSSDWAAGANATAQTTFATQNSTFGTLNTNIGSAYSRANAFAVWANSGLILANTINLAFYNTATVNAVATSNTPNGTNVLFSVNVSSSDWAVGANNAAQTAFGALNTNITSASTEVTSFQNGTIVLAAANLNFNNSQSVLIAPSANGTTQSNLQFSVNTNLNLTSLNVTSNIANTGNLLVTQNTFSGNITVTQNTKSGNLAVTTLMNTASLNVSANISNTGNLLVTQNTFTGNLAVTTLINTSSINVSANISNTGNLLVTQNTFSGNLAITQNTKSGNLSITTLINTASLNVSSTANVATMNILGILTANASPLTNLSTRAATGLVALQNVATLITSSVALTVDNYLSLTFNETGWYDIEVYLFVSGNSGSNGFGGFQFDLGSNTATIANLVYQVSGYSNNYITPTAAITLNNTVAVTNSNVSATNASPSWFFGKGSATITGVGNWGVRVAQNTSSANAVTVMPGSYFKATKIG